AVAPQQADPAGIEPIVPHARGEPVHEQHRITVTLVDEMDANAVRIEGLHCLASSATTLRRCQPLSSGAASNYIWGVLDPLSRAAHGSFDHPASCQRSGRGEDLY